jgi:hypothetical protein
MASPALTLDQAYGLLASWSATLASMARSRRSVRDRRAVLKEMVPALGYLENAIRRERVALARIEEDEEVKECFCCGEPTRCEPGICEQCRHDVDEILKTHYWGPRAQARKRPWERL